MAASYTGNRDAACDVEEAGSVDREELVLNVIHSLQRDRKALQRLQPTDGHAHLTAPRRILERLG